MNGEAAPGGIHGRIYHLGDDVRLTLEPTDPEDTAVQVWIHAAGVEHGGRLLTAAEARELADDLYARAALVEAHEPIAAVRALHRQGPRPDGSYGCRCGWVQDKPHRAHVADMEKAAGQ